MQAWLAGYITWTLATLLLGTVVIMGYLTFNTLFLIWLERKVSGHIQRRYGPMEVGPHGALQTVADMLKLLGKQLLTPVAVDRFVYVLAPLLIFLPTLCVASLIPVSGAEAFAQMPYGLIVIIALSGFTVIAIFMAGWSSNNKYAVLGGMRSVSQVIAYEIPILLAALSVVMLAGSMNLREIVAAQARGVPYLLVQPVAALLYFIGITAETNRAPFDIPEAESELVGGFHTEYSGMRFALFFFAEYTNMLVLGALGATLFLGGWLGPWLPGPAWLLLKAYALVFVMMWMRWTFPRLRFDQLMTLAWKLLIPVALVNLVVTALLVPRAG
ncbi:MAG: NADH-quinone oxidoreductase subunit H [Gemmatimonadetes bacterium RIFCSPLOWO2_02_FULL_71_11]|nr:MAG: NADH-quinone oxidoreductase subunit H [Gemmatimonadetes bacterium RIFCSPLOWO2_02_FULL_71_11]